MTDYDRELDVCGVAAPGHLLRAKRVMDEMELGQTLHVITTALTSVRDFEAWSKQSGYPVLKKETEGNKFHVVLRKV